MNTTQNQSPLLTANTANAASGAAQTSPEAAEKAAAEKAANAKPPRARRGPPADGGEEPRELFILTTSKLNDTNGSALRRGQAASVPVRRIEALLQSGKIRRASKEEIETATKRYGRARIN